MALLCSDKAWLSSFELRQSAVSPDRGEDRTINLDALFAKNI